MQDACCDLPSEIGMKFFKLSGKLEPVGLDEAVVMDKGEKPNHYCTKKLTAHVFHPKRSNVGCDEQCPTSGTNLEGLFMSEELKLKQRCDSLTAQLVLAEQRLHEMQHQLQQAHDTIQSLQHEPGKRAASESSPSSKTAEQGVSFGDPITQFSVSPPMRLLAHPTELCVKRERVITLLVGRVSDLRLGIIVILAMPPFVFLFILSVLRLLLYGELVSSARYNATFVVDRSRGDIWLILLSTLPVLCCILFSLCAFNRILLRKALKTFEVAIVSLHLFIAVIALAVNHLTKITEAGMEFQPIDVIVWFAFGGVVVIGGTLTFCVEALNGVQLSCRTLRILSIIGLTIVMFGVVAIAVVYRFAKTLLITDQICYWYDCTTSRMMFVSGLSSVCFFWLKLLRGIIKGKPFVLIKPTYELAFQ